MDAVETTPGHHEGILPSVNDLREARKLGGREKKQRKARVKHESSLFYGSHVGTREQAALDRVEAVASCVQMEVLERHLLASDDIVNHNRNKECESSGDREPYQTVRELNLSSSEADPEKGALELHAAAAARESVSDEKMVGKKLLQKKLRLPFSDMFISLVTWNRRNVFPGESTRLTSSFSSANSTQKSLFKNLTPQSCMSYTLTLVDRWHPKKPVAFAAVRAQLLRELASRIRVASGLDVDPFDMTPPIEEAARHQQDLDEARTLLANDAEVQRLLTLYGRLLQFDANVLLPGSQWWRFQRGYSTEEHSPFQLPFYPCSTLLQRIRKLKGIKSLRPPLHYAQVQPHLKLTVDIMHVCLTDHYLFGSEDVLAQDVMRLYEVYCFLSNYKSGEQLTTRLRSAILYSEEQLSLPISESLRRMLASSLLCTISCKINGQLLPRRAHIPLKVPTFSSAANHLLPSIWDYEDNEDEGGPGHKTHGAMDGERTEFSFGILLTEGLEELSFDVELQHAECSAPVKTTASVPISPELSCFTRPPTLSPVLESKELFPLTENYISSSAALASPVSIYVDVPFSSRRAALNCDTHRTKQPLDHSAVPVEFVFQPTPPAEPMGVPLGSSPYGTLSNNGVPCHVSRSLSEGRSHPHLLRVPSTFGPSSRRGSFLFQETELRLAVPSWDEEMASAAQEEAAAVAAAMAAEIEQEAYQAAAVVAAAAEAARQIAIPEEPTKFAWHTHRNQHVPNVAVAGDPGARTSVRGSHGKKLFDRRPLFTRQQGREHGTGASGSPAATEQHALVAAAEEQSLSSGDTHSRAAAEGRVGGAVEKPSRTLKKLEEEQVATPEVSVSPHPSAECRRPSPPTFAANASHTSPPNDSEVVPQQQLAGHHEATVVRHQLMGSGVPSYSQSCSPPRLPQPIYSPGATDPALPFRPPRPHIVASSASGAPLPTPAVVASGSIHQMPARSRRLLSFTRVSRPEDTDEASKLRIPLSHLFIKSNDTTGGSWQIGDERTFVLPGKAEQEGSSRRNHRSISALYSRLTSRSRTSEQLSVGVGPTPGYHPFGSEDTAPLTKGGLKLRVTLEPVPPGERAAEALLEGYEALVLRRQQLRAAVDGDPSLVTLYRHLPTTPGDLYAANRAEERAYAASAAAAAVAAMPAPEAAYHSGALQPRSSSTHTKRVVLLRDKKRQDVLDTRLGRSRPLTACVRLLILLQRCGALVPESQGPMLPLLAASTAAFVAPATVERLLKERGLEVPGLDAEVVALLQSMQKTVDAKSRFKQKISTVEERNILRDAEEEDDDEDELEEDDAAEDIYTRFLREFLNSALPVQVAAVLKSSSRVDFPAVVSEVVPRLNIHLLFQQIKACCCTHRLLGFTRYVEAKAARRRVTVIDPVDDRSIGIFVKVNLVKWHHRHRVGDISSASLDSPADFYLYSPRTHLQYSAQSRSRSTGATPFTFIGSNHTAYAEALQLSNPVVEVKYVNRTRGIHVAVTTKAVSGENPMINQLVHLTLPKVSKETEALMDLTKQDSYLILNVFDHHQRDVPPARRFLGSITLPWSLIIGYGLEDCFWTPSQGEEYGKHEQQGSSWRSARGHRFRIRRRRKEGPHGPITLCVIRGCLRLTQPACLPGYQRPTLINTATRCKSLDRGKQTNTFLGTNDSNSRIGSSSRSSSGVMDASKKAVNLLQEPLSMYISLSLYITGVPLRAARRSVASGRHHPIHIWCQAQDSIAACRSSAGSSLSTSSNGAMSPGEQRILGGDNQCEARGDSASATDHPVAREGEKLIIREEHWRNHCRRRGVWNPCSAFGLDLSGSLFLLCRLVAPLLPPPEVATPRSPRCFERIAAFISLFPVVDDRLLLSMHAGDRIWMTAQEQVDVGCGDSRGHALLLCCFFSAFDLMLQTQCTNYVARARICDKGVQYVVLRQASDGSVQVWDPLEPRCVFLPSAAFRKRSRKQAQKRSCGGGERGDSILSDQWSSRPLQALTSLQQQELIQQNALLREQQNDQVAMLRVRHAGLLEGSHDKFLKQFSKDISNKDLQNIRNPSPVFPCTDGTAGQEGVQVISTCQEQLGPIHHSVQNTPFFPPEQSSCSSVWDGVTVNHDLPFPIGGTCSNQEKGVLPIEGIDLVFNNENALTNLQSMECVSSSSNGATRHHSAGERWEPLTGGCSVPESDRKLRDKIRRKLLRRKKKKCCGLIYACRLLKDFIMCDLQSDFNDRYMLCLNSLSVFPTVGSRPLRYRFVWLCTVTSLLVFPLRFIVVNDVYSGTLRRLKPPPKAVNLFDMSFDFSNKSKWSALLPSLQNVRISRSSLQERELRSLSDPSALAAATEAFRDCLLQKNDGASAAEAAALALGATSPDALLRISLFPPVGLITPMVQALRYRTADFACARALEARLQRHIEAHIKALYRRDRSLSSDGSGRTSVNTVSTVRDSSSFDGRGASTAPLSRPRQSVFFSRDAATEIYRLLKHFETARMCMAWQQPISPDERRSHRESIFPETTTGAKCGSQPNKESCAQSHIFPSSPTGEARNAQGEDWSSCCPSDLESRLQDCLRKYYKERETPYAVPLHFSRMDKHFVWQLLENTGVFAPVPQKAAFAHTQLAGLGGAREELCRSRQCLRPLGATVAVVVRVFAYPCGVYSGWVCAARLD
uniref:Uncharacterized protein n=1 Tax=Toxoplasma gondii (strain ATCC 50861 / VEG) TaxID=432359 RepID=A0A0F7UXN9_TOXGV|nr:TPA: hypothetical protein BN1205_024920 [Toxoplasma gondii VEG]